MKCTHFHSGFDFVSYPRLVAFAAPKGPEQKSEAFKAPEVADKKSMDDLKASTDLKMGQIEGAHTKVKADVQRAKEAAKVAFEKSTKTEADKKAFDAFVAQMDKLSTDADAARVELFSKLDAQTEARRKQDQEAMEKKLQSQLLSKDVQIGKMEQKGKFSTDLDAQGKTVNKDKDITDAALASMDNHDFEGDDFQDNTDPANKFINYQNKSRSMAEGYLRAQMIMGQQAKGEKDLQSAYNMDEGFGPELVRDHNITEENLRKSMDVESFIKSVDVSSKGAFLTDNERIYVATLMKEAQTLWGTENQNTKEYRAFVEARLAQIMPLLQANKDKAIAMISAADHSTASKVVGGIAAVPSAVVGGVFGVGVGAIPAGAAGYESGRRMTRNILTPDAVRDAYNKAAEYERNLVMNTVPAPKEWADHKDKYQENPEVSQMEVKMRTEYVDKAKAYIPRAEALWTYSDQGVTKKYIAEWQADADRGLERKADGSFARQDMSPEYIVGRNEKMKNQPSAYITGWQTYLKTEGPKYPAVAAKATELVAALDDVKNNFDAKTPDQIREIMKRVDRFKGNIDDGLYGAAQAVPEGATGDGKATVPAKPGEAGKPGEPGKPGEAPAVGPDGKPLPAPVGPGLDGGGSGGTGGGSRRGGGVEGGGRTITDERRAELTKKFIGDGKDQMSKAEFQKRFGVDIDKAKPEEIVSVIQKKQGELNREAVRSKYIGAGKDQVKDAAAFKEKYKVDIDKDSPKDIVAAVKKVDKDGVYLKEDGILGEKTRGKLGEVKEEKDKKVEKGQEPADKAREALIAELRGELDKLSKEIDGQKHSEDLFRALKTNPNATDSTWAAKLVEGSIYTFQANPATREKFEAILKKYEAKDANISKSPYVTDTRAELNAVWYVDISKDTFVRLKEKPAAKSPESPKPPTPEKTEVLVTETKFESDFNKLPQGLIDRYRKLGSNQKGNYEDYVKWSVRAEETLKCNRRIQSFSNTSSKYPAVAYIENGKMLWKPGKDASASVKPITNLNEWYISRLEKDGQDTPEQLESKIKREVEGKLKRVEERASQWDGKGDWQKFDSVGAGSDYKAVNFKSDVRYIKDDKGRWKYDYAIDEKSVGSREAFVAEMVKRIKG